MIFEGDALTQLKAMDSESVDCCVTSPPYWGLRDYGHPDQIGLEESFDAFIDRLVAVFAEVRRVLRKDGTLWVVMGDSFASDATGGSPSHRNRASKAARTRARRPFGLRPKNLIGQAWRLALALQADGWVLRQCIIWHKTAPMPESVKDRPTTAHEYVFLLSRSERYFYDAAAVSEPCASTAGNTGADAARAMSRRRKNRVARSEPPMQSNGLPRPTRNRRSVWTIRPEPSRHGHSAAFPRELARICILAGSRPSGRVLDPFFGSGTVGVVADEEGRDWVGIEINPEFAAIARRRTEARAP